MIRPTRPLVLFLVFTSMLTVHAALPQCAPEDDQAECAVLIEIAAIDQSSALSSLQLEPPKRWLGGTTFCEWTGITCNTVPNTVAELILNEALQRRQITKLVLDSQVSILWLLIRCNS